MLIRSRAAIALGAGCLAITVVSACSSSASHSSSAISSKSGSPGATPQADLAAAKAEVSQLENVTGPTTLPMPTTAVKVKPEKVMVISCDQAEVGCADFASGLQQAAKVIGWNVTVEDGANSVQKEAGFIQQAIQQHYNGILMAALNGVDLASAVNSAHQAGIPIANVGSDDLSSSVKNEIMDVTEQGTDKRPGQALGAWIIAQSAGTAKVVALKTTAFQIVVDNLQGVQDELRAHCPGCTYKDIDFPLTDVGQPGPPTWSATLASMPKGSFDYGIAAFDGLVPSMANSAQQEGRTEISLGSFDTSAPTQALIAQGTPSPIVEAVPPAEFECWAAVDLVARALAKTPTWDATNLPVRLLTHENYKDFGGQPYWQPNFDYKTKFEALWGVK